MLSFGEEAEGDEEETVQIIKKFSGKSKSAHDNLSDPKLSSQSVIETEDFSKNKNDSDSDSEELKKDEAADKERR